MNKSSEQTRTCDTCVNAAQHPFKPASKVICMEGYGVQLKKERACKAFKAFPGEA